MAKEETDNRQQMTLREFKRSQREAIYGTNIPNVKEKRAIDERSITGAKRQQAVKAGFVPPTEAASGDLLARRQELAKQMLSGNREQALALRDTASELGVNERGFAQVLNRIPLSAAPTAAPTTAPVSGTPKPAVVEGDGSGSMLKPVATNPLAPKPLSLADRVLSRYDNPVSPTGVKSVEEENRKLMAEGKAPKIASNSREDQVADAIKRIRDMTVSTDEKPNSMLRTTALAQINKERVAAGQAPLNFGKEDWNAVGATDKAFANRRDDASRAEFAAARARADGSAPVFVAGQRVPAYAGMTGAQLQAIASQGEQRRKDAAGKKLSEELAQLPTDERMRRKNQTNEGGVPVNKAPVDESKREMSGERGYITDTPVRIGKIEGGQASMRESQQSTVESGSQNAFRGIESMLVSKSSASASAANANTDSTAQSQKSTLASAKSAGSPSLMASQRSTLESIKRQQERNKNSGSSESAANTLAQIRLIQKRNTF